MKQNQTLSVLYAASLICLMLFTTALLYIFEVRMWYIIAFHGITLLISWVAGKYEERDAQYYRELEKKKDHE